ncbi:MAG TPA: hypothetical protein QF571_02510, partial [Desulfobacterales bacterium]|nr:hypothetical protein [Desulfobacterales bacterium]
LRLCFFLLKNFLSFINRFIGYTFGCFEQYVVFIGSGLLPKSLSSYFCVKNFFSSHAGGEGPVDSEGTT